MSSPPSFPALRSLAEEHRGGAPAGEVFLALENVTGDLLAELWEESLSHEDKEIAVAIESACASRWSDLDLPQMAKAVFHEERSARGVIELAAAMLIRLPHDEAWTILRGARHEPERACLAYLSMLARIEPGVALDLLRSVDRVDRSGTGRDRVVKEADKAHPAKAVSWMKNEPVEDCDVYTITRELASHDPAAALEIAHWLAGSGRDFLADSIGAQIFDIWARSDAAAAGAALLEWLGGTNDRTPVTSWYTGQSLQPVTGKVFHGWAKAAPQQALEGALSISPAHIRHLAMNSIGIGWTPAEDALKAARSLSMDNRLAFIEMLSQRLAESDPDVLRVELEMLPPPESAEEAGAMHGMWSHLGEGGAEEFKARFPQWFSEGTPGHGPIDVSVASLLSKFIATQNSREVSEERLSRIRALIEPAGS